MATDDVEVELDLSDRAQLAALLALVPEWFELSKGFDLTTPEGQRGYADAVGVAANRRASELAAEAAVLNLLPPTDRNPS